MTHKSTYSNSIESLNVESLINDMQINWQNISLSQGSSNLAKRSNALVAPFSQTEIIIMGGYGATGAMYHRDFCILNTNLMTLEAVGALFKPRFYGVNN